MLQLKQRAVVKLASVFALTALFSVRAAYADNYTRDRIRCSITATQQDIDTPEFQLPFKDYLNFFAIYNENLVVMRTGLNYEQDSTSNTPLSSSTLAGITANSVVSVQEFNLWNDYVLRVSRYVTLNFDAAQTISLLKHLGARTLQSTDPLPAINALEVGMNPDLSGLCHQVNLTPNLKDGLSFHVCYQCNQVPF